MASRKAVGPNAVRSWGRENTSLVPEEARKGLGEKSRGRLHPALVEAFEKANPKQRYVVGTSEAPTITVRVPLTNKAGRAYTRKVSLPVAEVRSLAGDAAKGRGRLTDAAVEAAGAAYAARLTAEAEAPQS